MSKSRKLRH